MLNVIGFAAEKVLQLSGWKKEPERDEADVAKGNDADGLIEAEATLVASEVTPSSDNQNLAESVDGNAGDDENSLKIFGTIIEVYEGEGLDVVDAGGRRHFIPECSVMSANVNLIKGDKVNLTAKVIEDGFGQSEKFIISSLSPATARTSHGKLVEITDEFWVFEERVILLTSAFGKLPESTLKQEFNYKCVESDQEVDGKKYSFRVVEILQAQELKTQDQIILKDIEVRVFESSSGFENKFVVIANRSNKEATLKSFRIEPTSSHFKYKPLPQPKVIRASTGRMQINFLILPRQEGRHEYALIAELEAGDEKFTKESKIIVDTVKSSQYIVLAPRSSNQQCRFKDIHVEFYWVPQELRLINFTNVQSARQELIAAYPFLDEDLNAENYINRLSYGIFIEEIALEMAFLSYNMQRVRFETCGDNLRLAVKDIAEKRPSIIVGDIITANDPFGDESSHKFQGRIVEVENDAVKVKFHERFHESHHGKGFDVSFSFSRNVFRKKHHAIAKVTANDSLGYDFLFPELVSVIESKPPQLNVKLQEGKLMMNGMELPWYDQKLNLYQKKSIVNVLRGECRPFPYIVNGPPGTGKTMTVIELIKQIFFLIPTANLIIATPSNSAANLFTEALIKSQRFHSPHDFIRIVSNNQVVKEAIPDTLMKYCATLSIKSDDGTLGCEPILTESGLRRELTKSKIVNYRICISTLSCLGSFMQMQFPDNHFSHVLIDEAGQSIEPETLIPMTLLSKDSGQVVLAGDPKQLGPMCMSPFSKSLKLDSSMLERLLTKDPHYAQSFGPDKRDYDSRLVTKLKKNYRSLPSVLQLYNDLFYGSDLESTVTDDDSPEAGMLSMVEDILYNRQTANPKCGIYFVNVVKGVNRKVSESCSWYNQAEIDAVFSFLCKLNTKGISFKDIGVITPYALQVRKLRHKAASLPDTDLKIGTVEEFQGQERQIVMLSTVRSEQRFVSSDNRFGLGFLQCEKRMNVAISRARSLLIVFGKAEVLKGSEKWKQLLDYTVQNGTFVSI